MTLRDSAGERAARQIVISEPIAVDRRREELGYDALGEIEQQFQTPVSANVGNVANFSTVTVSFEVDFFDAPEQRDSSLGFPHFTFGAFLTGEGAGVVMLSAAVSEWITDDARGAFTGAIVNVAMAAPGTDVSIACEGYVHFTFQGFGAPTENIPQLDVGT